MKTLKVTKKMLKMHPADLMIKIGAVNKEKTIVYPQYVYFSKKDYQELKLNLKKYAKNKFLKHSNNILDYSVNIDLLNYGPNETLSEAIRPGYMIVNEEELNKVKE